MGLGNGDGSEAGGGGTNMLSVLDMERDSRGGEGIADWPIE